MPDLVKVALDCEAYGAQGITIHPRPDQRHARYQDVADLKAVNTTELNIEGNPTPKFLEVVLANRPDQCTLVPDVPAALTSDAGWDTIKYADFLQDVTHRLKAAGIRVSIFVDADERWLEGAKHVGADRVEFYTGPYAEAFTEDKAKAIAPYARCAAFAEQIGIGVNAGHDLNLDNLSYFHQNVPNLLEVSIGHALISDTLYYGLHNTIQMYLQRLNS